MGLLCQFTPEELGWPRVITEYAMDGTPIEEEVDYSKACNVFVSTFMSVSRSTVPVDTGYLYSTLNAGTDGWNVSASTECEYAEHVEYGTWKQAAQPYFEPAVDEAYDLFCVEASAAVEDAQWLVSLELESINSSYKGMEASANYLAMTMGVGPAARMGGGPGPSGWVGAWGGGLLDWGFATGDAIFGTMSIGGTITGAALGGLMMFLTFPIALGLYGITGGAWQDQTGPRGGRASYNSDDSAYAGYEAPEIQII